MHFYMYDAISIRYIHVPIFAYRKKSGNIYIKMRETHFQWMVGL